MKASGPSWGCKDGQLDNINLHAGNENCHRPFLLPPPFPFNLIKVAHHTWIKFLKSRRDSLMMKNEVTYDRYECTKRKWNNNHILVKILLWKLISVTFNKSLRRIWTRDLRFTKLNTLNHWAMMIYKKVASPEYIVLLFAVVSLLERKDKKGNKQTRKEMHVVDVHL